MALVYPCSFCVYGPAYAFEVDIWKHGQSVLMIFRIVRAWWYWFSGKNRELMKERLKACQVCELRMAFVCGKCGCELHAKASDPEEHCPHPKGDKWEPRKSVLSGIMLSHSSSRLCDKP